MLPKHRCRMQNQKMKKRYATLSKTLFLNDKVQYLAIANVISEIIEIYHTNRQMENILSNEELSEHLRKITLATSMLTFENIRLMVLDLNASKAMLLNLAEDTIIIGMKKDTLLPDLAQVFDYISQEIKSS